MIIKFKSPISNALTLCVILNPMFAQKYHKVVFG